MPLAKFIPPELVCFYWTRLGAVECLTLTNHIAFSFFLSADYAFSNRSIMSTYPQNYDRFLNSISTKRSLSALRRIWEIQHNAGPRMISLGTGVPNPLCFPFESFTARTKSGQVFTMEGPEMDTALSYTASPGFPPLIEWLMAFQKRLHDPPYARENPQLNQLIVVPGSEDGQCKVLEMILEPGDPVLITQPAYPGLISAIRPLGAIMIPVDMDKDGVRPDSLEQILCGDSNIKLFVIQPNHVNPTGVSTKLERLKEIYRLACQYDILILEDDPYYFLTFNPDHSPSPSMLSLDTQGRVLRLESFSKVVSGGLRVGTLSGPRPLVERVVMHIGCSTLQASTLSQTLLLRLLTEYGQNGYLEHCKSVAVFYEERCRMMLEAAECHLRGLAEWNSPSGGMFLWMKIVGVKDTRRMIEGKALEKMVMLAPGCYFMIDENEPTQYLRASFSWASGEEMHEGFRRLADMIKEEKDRVEY